MKGLQSNTDQLTLMSFEQPWTTSIHCFRKQNQQNWQDSEKRIDINWWAYKIFQQFGTSQNNESTNSIIEIERNHMKIPRPGGTLGDEIITGDDELRDTENAFLFEGGDGSRPCDPLNSSFEGLVELLRQSHDRKLSEIDELRWKIPEIEPEIWKPQQNLDYDRAAKLPSMGEKTEKRRNGCF